MKDKNIGFIGLGNLGKNLAKNILKKKYNLNVYDINKSKSKSLIRLGAICRYNIKDIINHSSIIITCLPSIKSTKKVIEGRGGILNYINKNHLWIEMSTTDEKEMIRLSKLIEKKGANVLEAPVTGGQHKAAKGNISILVAGKRKNFNRALPILSELGYKILYCGKNIGSASTLKVVTNFLATINLVSIGEALIVCKKYGIDLKKAYQGIKISSGNSFVHETESKLILNGSYNVGFTMDLVLKDINLFHNLTKNLKIYSKITPLLNKIFKKGERKYGSRSLSTSIVKLFEQESKTKLRYKGFPSKLIDYEPRKKGLEIK